MMRIGFTFMKSIKGLRNTPMNTKQNPSIEYDMYSLDDLVEIANQSDNDSVFTRAARDELMHALPRIRTIEDVAVSLQKIDRQLSVLKTFVDDGQIFGLLTERIASKLRVIADELCKGMLDR